MINRVIALAASVCAVSLYGQIAIPAVGGSFSGPNSGSQVYSLYVAPGQHYVISSNNISTTSRPLFKLEGTNLNALLGDPAYLMWLNQLQEVQAGTNAYEMETWIDEGGKKHEGTVPPFFQYESTVVSLRINTTAKWSVNCTSPSAYIDSIITRTLTVYNVVGGPLGSSITISFGPGSWGGSGNYSFKVIPQN